ncbi:MULTISPECIES: nitroreductase family protein [Bacillaceae]|uniref:nitroreductase family protein n=1 Tax=Bacillaceae TaxID=186817 RepID=UPI001BDE3393|nr:MULTISPECIES: nitroreductase family protein [Bacillaceae]MDX8360808.1 nitroreductase family protein [Cytobacillus sp. IB215316]
MTTTNVDLTTVINDRHSIRVYDPSVKIDKNELNDMIQEAAKAPSAWNLQHWKFLVIDDPDLQNTLLPIAFNQQQVVDASAVIAILGDLEANKNAERVYSEAVAAGFMTEEAKSTLIGQINGAYQSPEAALHSAILNPSLAAMQLMLIAKARGYDTCSMAGYDSAQFIKTFNIPSRYVPVMLLTIGKKAKDAHATNRFPVEDITLYNNF